MQNNFNKREGFSFIEILVVVAGVILLASVTLVTLHKRRNVSDLNSATQQIIALLHDAQSRASSQMNGANWGVHFDNTATAPFYALYQGSYSSTSTPHYRLPADVQFVSSSIAVGSSLDVPFSQISGSPSASATITIALKP